MVRTGGGDIGGGGRGRNGGGRAGRGAESGGGKGGGGLGGACDGGGEDGVCGEVDGSFAGVSEGRGGGRLLLSPSSALRRL